MLFKFILFGEYSPVKYWYLSSSLDDNAEIVAVSLNHIELDLL